MKIFSQSYRQSFHCCTKIYFFKFSRLGSDEQKLSVNPMCATFPLDTSCSLPIIGAAGGETTLNGICVLSQNIFNQKMYLVIWWWLTILICISPLCMIYRLVTIFFDPFRSALVMGKLIQISFSPQNLGVAKLW